MASPPRGRTLLLTAAAMAAFAANSLLCRAALGGQLIDAPTFTTVRLLSGALTLAALSRARRTRAAAASWPAALALFAYALAFSLAYLLIPAGVGALLLFGAVQVTMLGHAILAGAHLRRGEWIGLALAIVGLVVLTRPGLSAPDPVGAWLMGLAGAAWGVYTLLGRNSGDPLLANARNFARAALPAVGASAAAAFTWEVHGSVEGLALAMASGAVTSGIGYAIWYAALAGLTPSQAAIVQLSAPVLAAIGGVVLLGEAFTARLAWAAGLVLGGIALAVLVRDAR